MNDSHIYVGLDIGTTSIKALVCEDVKGELRVVGVGTQPAGGLSRGVIVDIEKTAHAIQAAVRQATEKSGIKIDKVIVGLPANYLQMTEVHGMITVANQGQPREIINQDVIDVASAAMTQNLPPEREVIDLVLRDFAVDDFNKIEDPRGMAAVRLELRATMYSGPKTIVHNTKKAVALAGLQIQDLVVAPIATGFELLSDGEQDFGTVLVDLGGGQTTTSIIHDHQLKFAYVDPEGGNLITHDISTVLNTSQRNAEQLKRDHGYADSRQASDEVQLAVDVVGKNQPVNYSEKYLAEVIEARVRQIFERSQKKLQSINAPQLPGGVVLLGGVAILPGIKEIASEYYDGNVKVYIPDQMGVRHPSFALAIALCKYEDDLRDVDQLLKETVHQEGNFASVVHQVVQQAAQTSAAPQPTRRPAPSRPAPQPSQPEAQAQEQPVDNQPTKKKKKNPFSNFFNNFFD